MEISKFPDHVTWPIVPLWADPALPARQSRTAPAAERGKGGKMLGKSRKTHGTSGRKLEENT